MSRARRRALGCAGAAAWLLLAGAALAAEKQAKPSKQEPAAAADAEVDPEAVAIAQRAGDSLRAQSRFSFRARTTYEVVQEDGSKLEFGATRHHLVKRPDRVRVEVQPRSGEDRLIVFDGDRLTVAQPRAKLYAQIRTKQHRSTDEAIALLRDVLGVAVPLADLLRSDPRPEIVGSLTDAYRVGNARIDGAQCDHVALRNPDADVQLWIEQGDSPVLRRVVITYRNEPGAPTFAADLDEWRFDPSADDEQFRYTPPADAERIRFAVPATSSDAAAKRIPEAAP